MTEGHGNFSFKASRSKSASEIASEIFQDTFVESAYDKKGKFSHLLARLPQSEFVRLYSAQTTASIFIQGYWLLLCMRGNKKSVLNRETQIQLTFEVAVNEYGITELSFFRFEKRVCRFKLQQISAADLLGTETGYHYIARAAVKAFHKVQNSPCVSDMSLSHLPVVLVLMQQEQKAIYSSEFNSDLVLLQ